jgi:DNA repair exonuclease SbcCD nuclease subunit
MAAFEPFQPLLQAGVRFYATLGNHDTASNRSYGPEIAYRFERFEK